MSPEPEQHAIGPVDTEGVPSVYCNQVALSMSFHDIRIYASEVTPKKLNINPAGLSAAEPVVHTRLSLVMNPEFAKTLLDSLATTIAQYESKFGPLRVNPNPPTILKL